MSANTTSASYKQLEERSRITNLLLRWFLYFVLILFASYFIFPLYVMVVTSFKTMEEIVVLGVDIFNIGQYLQPTKKHLKVERYVSPDQFDIYKEFGLKLGFSVVESGPLVRSSYMADKQAKLMHEKTMQKLVPEASS